MLTFVEDLIAAMGITLCLAALLASAVVLSLAFM